LTCAQYQRQTEATEQHGQNEQEYDSGPRYAGAGQSRGSVLRVFEVELPPCPVGTGDDRAHVASAHGNEQSVHVDPLARPTGGQRRGDHLAVWLGRGQDIGDALAFDLFDPAEGRSPTK
jgi:hypothetical protein